MKKWCLLFFLFMFIFIPRAFAADDVFSLISQSSEYPSEDREYLLIRVGDLVNELQQNGLAADSLVLKLKEGLRKKVRPYNIVKNLEKKKDSLLQAQAILKEVKTSSEIIDVNILNDIALSLEYSVPVDLIKGALKQGIAKDENNVKKLVDSLTALIEMGVQPQQAGSIVNQFAQKSSQTKDLNSLTKIIERARYEGIDPPRVASKIEEALKKTNSITMVEMEVQGFIADMKQKPTIKSGQGVVVSSPGISSSGVPGSEGGTSLSPTSKPNSSGSSVPSQEGGSPLE